MSDNQSGFLSYMAIGDAFGMKYEFVSHSIPVNESELSYGSHPKFIEYNTGHYTDDTQMALANAELLFNNSDEIRRDDFINAWNEAFRRDPRLGYSKYMYGLMEENLQPDEFCKPLDASKGTTSGAAMRAAPFGLIANLETAKRLTREQAVITHNTDAGIISAQAVALATHFLHHGGQPKFLDTFLDRHLGKEWGSPANGRTDEPGNGMKIVLQSLNALKDKTSLSKILLAGLSQAEVADTDTVCAIATAIASRREDFQMDVPENLTRDIENGPYGFDYLRKIDSELLKKFPRTNQYKNFSL